MKMDRLLTGHKVILALVMPAMLAVSCEYEPVKVFEATTTETPVPPDIETNISIKSDTILIYWPHIVKIYLNAGDLEITDVMYQLQDKVQYAEKQANYYIVFLTYTVPYTSAFRVIILAKTGTGSIGDKLGIERYQYLSDVYTVICGPPDVDHNLSYFVDGEGLHLTWKSMMARIPGVTG
jgi:hypothetical protein